MPSPFMGIDIASRALRAFQYSLDVTGNNISNVNTKGYSRQTADLAQTEPTIFYSGQRISLGSGVTVATVYRARDMFLQSRRLDAQAEQGRLDTLVTNLGQVDSTLLEPSENGIGNALTSFFDAWSSLASNPNESASRSQVQMAGQTLANRVRDTYGRLQTLKTQFRSEIETTFDNIDQLTGKIADFNAQIRAAQAGGVTPNDLLDQRDLALQELSKLVNVSTHQFSDGSIAVYTGQVMLVDSGGAIPIPRSYDAAAQTVSNGQFTYRIREGKLAGLFQTVSAIASYQSQLDALANNLRTQVNTLHQTGVNKLSPPTTGLNFFNDSVPQNGAIDFDLAPEVKANPDAIAAGTTGKAGDGGLALILSQLRDTQIASLGNKTFNAYYTEFAANVGSVVDGYKTALSAKTAVLSQIDAQIQSISGVSLDDEMGNMLRFQRSYQAAAKMLNIFDQVTGDLISMVR